MNKRKKLLYVKQNWQLYVIFMLPAFLLTLVFKYFPIGGIIIAFQDYNGMTGIIGSPWVGFEHFSRFLSSPDFMKYLVNTLKLSVYGLLWGFPIPIFIALMLNMVKSTRLKKKIQLIIYAPNFISTIVLSGMIFIFLSPVGPLNRAMGTSINYMANPDLFRTIYIASGIWQGAGWGSILYTAVLSNSPKELKEAAVIDGANIFRQILTVDLPTLKPVIIIQLILQTGGIMSIGFEKAFALQTSLNIDTSEIIATYVYKLGLQMGDFSYSTAVGLFNSVINVILLLSVNFIVKRLNEGEGL